MLNVTLLFEYVTSTINLNVYLKGVAPEFDMLLDVGDVENYIKISLSYKKTLKLKVILVCCLFSNIS